MTGENQGAFSALLCGVDELKLRRSAEELKPAGFLL
jgi:hypothetical protein